MNLAGVSGLSHAPLPQTIWYRAINTAFMKTPLGVAHSAYIPSRFNEGPPPSPFGRPFEILYLAQNPLVALYEVGALYGSPSTPGGAIPHPTGTWTTLSLAVHLTGTILDLTDVSEQVTIDTSVQELTGDWRGYHHRSASTPIPAPVAPAPTQELGWALYDSGIEAFLTVSAKVPYYMNLVVFPQNLLSGSYLEFHNPLTSTTERLIKRP